MSFVALWCFLRGVATGFAIVGVLCLAAYFGDKWGKQ